MKTFMLTLFVTFLFNSYALSCTNIDVFSCGSDKIKTLMITKKVNGSDPCKVKFYEHYPKKHGWGNAEFMEKLEQFKKSEYIKKRSK